MKPELKKELVEFVNLIIKLEAEKKPAQKDTLKNKITKNTKALLLPQLYGNSADMDEVLKFVNDNNLFLIEDSAEVFGSKFKNKSLGTFGIAGSFSFFGNKEHLPNLSVSLSVIKYLQFTQSFGFISFKDKIGKNNIVNRVTIYFILLINMKYIKIN